MAEIGLKNRNARQEYHGAVTIIEVPQSVEVSEVAYSQRLPAVPGLGLKCIRSDADVGSHSSVLPSMRAENACGLPCRR